MPPAIIALVVLVGSVALGALLRARGTAAVAAQCDALRNRLATLGPGGDPAERARLEAGLRLCAEDLAARGIEVDFSDIELQNATAASMQIDQLWSDYLATSYADPISRSGKRGAIFRLLDGMVDTLNKAGQAATTDAGKNRVREAIQGEILKSLRRVQCLTGGQSGCGRDGVNEPDWDERARDELQHGAFALGLRTAIGNGWRTPRDRGGPETASPAWDLFRRAEPSGNVPPADLFRVGELAELIDPSWDVFGGGPHYAGQTTTIRTAWQNTGRTPYDNVKLFQIADIGKLVRPIRRFGNVRLGT